MLKSPNWIDIETKLIYLIVIKLGYNIFKIF